MTDRKISELGAIPNISPDSDIVPIVDVDASQTKSTTVKDLVTSVVSLEVADYAALDALTSDEVAVGEDVRRTDIDQLYTRVNSGGHIATTGGLSFDVVSSSGEYPIAALGVDVSDAATDQSAIMQKAINFAANNKAVLVAPSCRIRCDQLYLSHDPILNPEMTSDVAEMGAWGIRGVRGETQSSVKAQKFLGLVIYSEATTGTPFVHETYSGNTNKFVSRGLVLENVYFYGQTSGQYVDDNNMDAVFVLGEAQGVTLTNFAVRNLNDDGDSLIMRDVDQYAITNCFAFGAQPSAGVVNGTGTVFQYRMINIDASRCFINGLLISDGYAAGGFYGSGSNVVYRARNTHISGLGVANTYIAFDMHNIENMQFSAPQFRGDVTALNMTGTIEGVTIDAAVFSADGNDSGTIIDSVVHMDGDFKGFTGRNCTFNMKQSADPHSAIKVVDGGTDNWAFVDCEFYFPSTSHAMLHLGSVPKGGRLTSPSYGGTGGVYPARADLLTGSNYVGKMSHIDYGPQYAGIGWSNYTTLHGAGGTTASATTMTIPPARAHVFSGTTSINTINIDGFNPVEGMQIVIRNSAIMTFLSKSGGGTGTGNIAIASGDYTPSTSNEVITLTYIGGNWR